MSIPGISVVIPAYNAQHFIADALSSIQRQVCPALEVIVIDDGSRDKTQDVVQQWTVATKPPFKTICVRQSNGGISSARNAGIARARGTWIAFLDADDIWEANHLQQLTVAIAAAPDAILAYGAGRLLEGDVLQEALYDDFWDNPSKTFGLPIDGTPYLRLTRRVFARLVKGNFIKPSSMMVRAQALNKVGVFDPTLGVAEDRELLVRLIVAGDFVYCPEPIAQYRWHDDNASQRRNAKRNREFGLRAIRMVQTSATLELSLAEIDACSKAIDAAASDYLTVCSRRGWSDYISGLKFVKHLLGTTAMLQRARGKEVVRSLYSSMRGLRQASLDVNRQDVVS